jgi:filamentous hemagglutinin family protein
VSWTSGNNALAQVSLFADVDIDGNIQVYGTRLLLAGGNGLGSNPVPNVEAKLFCGTSDTAFDSPAVPMGANGNFSIVGVLSSTPPEPCTNAVLLIVAAPNGAWLAAGIPDNNRQ